jgi:hypothetical protein
VVDLRRRRPRCAVYITMGKTDPEAPKHSQQSMIWCRRHPRRARRAPAERDGL